MFSMKSGPRHCPPQAGQRQYQPDKTKWTKLQHQQLAFVEALEKMPCLWDMRDPTFRDVDYVEQTVEKLRRIHQKIFDQRRMLCADDVFALVGDMQSKSEKAIYEAEKKYGSPTDLAQYQKLCAYADNICCYATAMLYTAPSRMHELQLTEELKGPRLFKHPNGENKSIRWLNGTIDEFQSMAELGMF